MRDIKFRAWHKEKNIMVYDNEDDTYGYWDGCCNSNVGMVNSILNSKYYENYEFMQYTGLKDKNGKEIYEGDILRYSYNIAQIEDENYLVRQNICGWEMRKTKKKRGQRSVRYTEKMEIIGNIYENPELLED